MLKNATQINANLKQNKTGISFNSNQTASKIMVIHHVNFTTII